MNGSQTELTHLQEQILTIVEEYAEEGARLPTDSVIGAKVDKTGGAVNSALHSLSCKSYIAIKTFGPFRAITISRTGKTTGLPDSDTIAAAMVGPETTDVNVCWRCQSKDNVCMCGVRGR